jgi:TM2 domain-containing membrane protein YozV
MVILLYLLQGIIAGADFMYLKRIQEGLQTLEVTSARQFIPQAQTMLTVHIVMVVITVILIALIPVLGKQLNKIDTSVALAENKDVNIELTDE